MILLCLAWTLVMPRERRKVEKGKQTWEKEGEDKLSFEHVVFKVLHGPSTWSCSI